MVRLLFRLVVFVVEPQVVHRAQQDADDHEDIRQVEDGVGHEFQVEHIHHVAAAETVDHVACAAAKHQHGGRKAQGVADDLLYHQIDHGGHQDDGDGGQKAGLAGEAAPGSAGVVQAGEPDDARQQRGRLAHVQVGGDPPLEKLVAADADGQQDDIPHSVSSGRMYCCYDRLFGRGLQPEKKNAPRGGAARGGKGAPGGQSSGKPGFMRKV